MDKRDMGSITLIGAEKRVFDGTSEPLWKREYRGLQADVDKLPTDDDLASGSSCLFLDSKQYYEYLAYNKTWYPI